jgi:hypothetical protein
MNITVYKNNQAVATIPVSNNHMIKPTNIPTYVFDAIVQYARNDEYKNSLGKWSWKGKPPTIKEFKNQFIWLRLSA